MNWLSEKYHALTSKEQKQLKFIIGFSLLSAYLFYAAYLWQDMFNAEKLANRKADRIEKRIGEIKPPELEDGINEKTLEELLQKEKTLEEELLGYSSQLLPLGDSAAREELKLSLTQLAFNHHLRLASLKTPELSAVTPLESMHGESLRTYFEDRPSFTLVLTGHYLNLVGFVEGLSQLQYQAHVSQFVVERLGEDNNLLKIELELRI